MMEWIHRWTRSSTVISSLDFSVFISRKEFKKSAHFGMKKKANRIEEMSLEMGKAIIADQWKRYVAGGGADTPAPDFMGRRVRLIEVGNAELVETSADVDKARGKFLRKSKSYMMAVLSCPAAGFVLWKKFVLTHASKWTLVGCAGRLVCIEG